MIAPYQAIRCADGYITLGAANERLFRRLCDVLGHPEWSAAARVRRRTPAACGTGRRSPIASKRSPAAAAAQPLARAVRRQRHPVRADQRLRAGVRAIRRSSRARDGASRPSIRRSDGSRRSGSPHQDERDAARRVTPRRRGSASTPTGAARGGVQQRRDRRAPPIRRGAVTTLTFLTTLTIFTNNIENANTKDTKRVRATETRRHGAATRRTPPTVAAPRMKIGRNTSTAAVSLAFLPLFVRGSIVAGSAGRHAARRLPSARRSNSAALCLCGTKFVDSDRSVTRRSSR